MARQAREKRPALRVIRGPRKSEYWKMAFSTDLPPTTLRDTPQRYGSVTRFLHWVIAGLILLQLLGVVLKVTMGRESAAAPLIGLHAPTGTLLFVLIVIRLIWSFANRGNRPPHAPGLVGKAAMLGHLVLNVLMLVIPLLALLRAWGGTRAFAPFGFEIFPARETAIAWTGELAGALHGELGWVMAVLILGHVGMVIVHEKLWRDGTLSRMAGRKTG